MNSVEARQISDEVNKIDEDRIDADYKHIEIEIFESAKRGFYQLHYQIIPRNQNFGELYAFKSKLKSFGFEVEIEEDTHTLKIDWSNEKIEICED